MPFICIKDSDRRTLVEKCIVNEDDNDETLSYKNMGHTKLCWCKTGYVMDTFSLKCRKGNELLYWFNNEVFSQSFL